MATIHESDDDLEEQLRSLGGVPVTIDGWWDTWGLLEVADESVGHARMIGQETLVLLTEAIERPGIQPGHPIVVGEAGDILLFQFSARERDGRLSRAVVVRDEL